MRAIMFLLAAASFAFAADTKSDDQWAKVKQLKSGTEIRVYKKGVVTPLLAKAGDATDDKLIVILKNTETAIDKKDVDRVDARPVGAKRTSVNTTSTNSPEPGSSSYSSGLSIGSKPDFETIYRRPPAAP